MKKLTKAFALGMTGTLLFTGNVMAAPKTDAAKTTTIVEENSYSGIATSIASRVGTERAAAGIAVSLQAYYDSQKDADAQISKILSPNVKSENQTLAETNAKYFKNLAVAVVSSYVNVRTKADVNSDIAGKIYNNCEATILKTKGDWYKIKSGQVSGWVKKDYFITDTEAQTYAAKNGYVLATVDEKKLAVKEAKNKKAETVSTLKKGETYAVKSYTSTWAQVAVDGNTSGYVSLNGVTISTNFDKAVTLEEEQKKEQAQYEAESSSEAKAESSSLAELESETTQEQTVAATEEQTAATEKQTTTQAWTETTAQEWTEATTQKATTQKATTQKATTPAQVWTEAATKATTTQTTAAATWKETQAKKTTTVKPEDTGASSSTGSAVVAYAMQFLGNPYVYGGSSLTNGTDCSGFTMSVYAHFGIYLNRTSSAQRANGYAVSFDALQPGDLICYSGHVALYIGGGQIIHASTPQTGIMISSMYYGSTPICARRVL